MGEGSTEKMFSLKLEEIVSQRMESILKEEHPRDYDSFVEQNKEGLDRVKDKLVEKYSFVLSSGVKEHLQRYKSFLEDGIVEISKFDVSLLCSHGPYENVSEDEGNVPHGILSDSIKGDVESGSYHSMIKITKEEADIFQRMGWKGEYF